MHVLGRSVHYKGENMAHVFFFQFNFIVEEVQTDTTVVPRGVVAAMKALREKEKAAKGIILHFDFFVLFYIMGYSVHIARAS